MKKNKIIKDKLIKAKVTQQEHEKYMEFAKLNKIKLSKLMRNLLDKEIACYEYKEK